MEIPSIIAFRLEVSKGLLQTFLDENELVAQHIAGEITIVTSMRYRACTRLSKKVSP